MQSTLKEFTQRRFYTNPLKVSNQGPDKGIILRELYVKTLRELCKKSVKSPRQLCAIFLTKILHPSKRSSVMCSKNGTVLNTRCQKWYNF